MDEMIEKTKLFAENSPYFTEKVVFLHAITPIISIRQFIARYRELAAAQKPIVAQQLAQESGYHSYSTFSAAFRQRMHKNVTDWMREEVFLQKSY